MESPRGFVDNEPCEDQWNQMGSISKSHGRSK